MIHTLLNNQPGTWLRCRSFQVLWTYKHAHGRQSFVGSLANNYSTLDTLPAVWKLKQDKCSCR